MNDDESKPIVSNTQVETTLGTIRLLSLMIMVTVMVTGCGYSKECNSSPLQEYNKYKE